MRAFLCPATNVGINRSPKKINRVIKAQRFTSTAQSKVLVIPLYFFSRWFFQKASPYLLSLPPPPISSALIHSRFRSRLACSCLSLSRSGWNAAASPPVYLSSACYPMPSHIPFQVSNTNSPNRHSPSRPASGQTRPSPCSTTHASSSLLRLLLPHPPCCCRTPPSGPPLRLVGAGSRALFYERR